LKAFLLIKIMAGDWIKMRIDLGDDPAVISIASLLELTEDEIVGKLHKLWSWADRHATNGFAAAITPRWVDKYVSHSGFSNALGSVEWIKFTDDGVIFPNFDRHNGKSAKTRCDAAIRQRLSRKERDNGVTSALQKALPEKRREEKIIKDTTPTIKDKESVCVIESPFADLPKETKSTMDELMAKINGLKPSWQKLARWTRNEMEALRGGVASQMETLTDDDWQLLKDFLNSSQAGYFRPDQRAKLCESFSGIWSTCERWKTETKYRTSNGKKSLFY
jgi:hypothetical protein